MTDPSRGRPFNSSEGVALDPKSGRPDPSAEALRLTRADRLYTLEEQVGLAVRLGFGDAKSLGRLHHKWRELDVLWGPDDREKAGKRGRGAGLWNQDQTRLWLECLRRRRDQGTQGHPRNLAAIPIGLWLWGRPGVPLDHARRAFHARWTAYLARPLASGIDARKSRKWKATARETNRLLGRDPGWRLLEDLRRVEPRSDKRVHLPIDERAFITALVESSARPAPDAHLVARGVYGEIAIAALALDNLYRLCYSKEQDWLRLWDWARSFIHKTWWSEYASEGTVFVPADLYDPSARAFLQGADRNLLIVLGIGLNPNPNATWPDGLYPPVSLLDHTETFP